MTIFKIKFGAHEHLFIIYKVYVSLILDINGLLKSKDITSKLLSLLLLTSMKRYFSETILVCFKFKTFLKPQCSAKKYRYFLLKVYEIKLCHFID